MLLDNLKINQAKFKIIICMIKDYALLKYVLKRFGSISKSTIFKCVYHDYKKLLRVIFISGKIYAPNLLVFYSIAKSLYSNSN